MKRYAVSFLSIFFLLASCRGQEVPNPICEQPSRALLLQELSPDSTKKVEVFWQESMLRPKRIHGAFFQNTKNPEDAAKRFLSKHESSFGLQGVDLLLKRTQKGLRGEYLRFSQYLGTFEVFGGEVIVHVMPFAQGLQVRDVNFVQQNIDTLPVLQNPIGELGALHIAQHKVKTDGVLRLQPEIALGIFVKETTAHYAYRIKIASQKPLADYELMIDAMSGEVLLLEDRIRHIDGSGFIFDPSPVSSTGNTSLNDNNDQTNPDLDAARILATLPRLDGSGILRGDFVDARPSNAALRVQSDEHTFLFTRNEEGFEEVMSYFHIDRVQERIQSLGFDDVNNRRQVVIVNGVTQDNSFYSPQTRNITFGTGGVDDAEDADIIVHEYGHSIHDDQNPNFFGGDSGAMGEGFGDYLAASMLDILSTEIVSPACVGDWDATSYSAANPPCLRRVDGTKHFPEARVNQVHADGEMWSAALFRARRAVGADVMDTLILESHFSLGANETFASAFSAIIAADFTLFSGQHVRILNREFIEQGISREITPPANLPDVLNTIDVTIENPRLGTGQYANRLDNSQTFTQPGAQGLRLHFSQFSTELDGGCFEGACDSVYLYDADGNLYQILNGNLGSFSSVVIPGDTVRIRLVTDGSVGDFGYLIDFVEVLGIKGAETCGNNLVEGTEDCDGTDLSSQSCESLGLGDGTLSCASNCTLDTSACSAAGTCGDGVRDPGEDCDGNDLNGQDCFSLGRANGILLCSNVCTFNVIDCLPQVCR